MGDTGQREASAGSALGQNRATYPANHLGRPATAVGGAGVEKLAVDEDDLAQFTFDKVRVGAAYSLGQMQLTAEDIVAFARLYDPQPFHLSDKGARGHPLFERMCASGWHTGVVLTRMMDCFWRRTDVKGLAGSGVDALRWLRPIYADEVLSVELEIVAVRASRSRPDIGFITTRMSARKDDGELAVVLEITGAFATGAGERRRANI